MRYKGRKSQRVEPTRLSSPRQIWASQHTVKPHLRWKGVVLKTHELNGAKYVACNWDRRCIEFDDFDAAVMAVRMMR